MSQITYISKEILIGSGTAGSTTRQAQKISEGYQRVIGIAIIEISNGGVPYYKLGFSDESTVFIDPVSYKLFEFGKDIKMEDRFIAVDIPGNGNNVYTSIVLPDALSSNFKVEVVFKLIKGDPAAKKC